MRKRSLSDPLSMKPMAFIRMLPACRFRRDNSPNHTDDGNGLYQEDPTTDRNDQSSRVQLDKGSLSTSAMHRHTTLAGMVLYQMTGVFAGFERFMIKDRMHAGLAQARAKASTSAD